MKNLCLLVALTAALSSFSLSAQIVVVDPPPSDDNELLLLNCSYIDNGTVMISIQAGSCGPFTPPLVLTWSGPESDTVTFNNFSVETEMDIPVPGLSVGIYTFNAVTGNNCSGVCEVKVLQGPGCEMVIETTDINFPSCQGAANGSISLLVENNVGAVTYQWSDGSAEGPARTGLSTGSYSVTVTDQGNGCTVEGAYDLYTDDSGVYPFVINIYPDSSFALPRTGGFSMGSDGGTPPFKARVLNPALNYDNTTGNIQNTEFTIGQLPAGEYTVILTDANGCEAAEPVTIGYKRVIPPGELFILEHADDISFDEFNTINKKIEKKALKRKTCRCGDNGIEYLQLWESLETIELLTSGDGSTTKTRPDTSGLSRRLIDPTWVDLPGTVNTPPCQGSAPSPKNVNVAVIDSGMDLLSPRRPNGHTELDAVYWTNGRTASGAPNPECHTDDYEGYDFVGETGSLFDSIGHGTHLSGIIKYTTPSNVNARLMNLKVCSPDPNYAYSVFDLTCALHYAVDSGAQVINLSLGYTEDIPSLPLYNALKRTEMADIPVIVSAGNSGQDLAGAGAPARWPVFFKKTHGNGEFQKLTNLLVVTSINDSNNNLDDYANSGLGLVDIATVGNYYSTYSYYNAPGTYKQEWKAFKGTSQAAAYASSVIAAVKAHNPLIKTSDLFQFISRTHQPVAGLSSKINIGGTLNPEALYRSVSVPVVIPQGITPTQRPGWTPKWSGVLAPRTNITATLSYKSKPAVLNNVWFYIEAIFKNSGNPTTIYSRFYCATDRVEWTLPSSFPPNLDSYVAVVKVAGHEFRHKILIQN